MLLSSGIQQYIMPKTVDMTTEKEKIPFVFFMDIFSPAVRTTNFPSQACTPIDFLDYYIYYGCDKNDMAEIRGVDFGKLWSVFIDPNNPKGEVLLFNGVLSGAIGWVKCQTTSSPRKFGSTCISVEQSDILDLFKLLEDDGIRFV